MLLGGVVYVGGGFEGISINDKFDSYRIDSYNLTTNQWSSSPIITPYCWFGMTVLDDKLITVGGATNMEPVRSILILTAGQWKDYSAMPTARQCATAVGYHSMLIVVGGGIKVEGEWTRVSTTELLDTINGCWYTFNSLLSPHQQMKAAIMDDKVYLLGGFDRDIKPSPKAYVTSLDATSSHQLNWQSVPNVPWCCFAPVVLFNKLLTVGGWQQSYTSKVCIFDSFIGQWKHLTNIPAARSAPAVVGMTNSILVMGGVTIDNKYSNTVWIGVFK